MEKIKITIEEVISQEFEVEVSDKNNAYEEIKQMYKDNKLELNAATLTQANVWIHDEENPDNDSWSDLHVN